MVKDMNRPRPSPPTSEMISGGDEQPVGQGEPGDGAGDEQRAEHRRGALDDVSRVMYPSLGRAPV